MVGFLLAVLGTFFLTVSTGSIQGMRKDYSEFELNVFRFAGSFVLAPPVLLIRCVRVCVLARACVRAYMCACCVRVCVMCVRVCDHNEQFSI